MNSASYEHYATDIWHLDAQEIAVPLKRATCPVVNLLVSLSPVQSESVYISSFMWF